MIERILEGYGAISAISTVAILIWGWAHKSNTLRPIVATIETRQNIVLISTLSTYMAS